MRLPGLFDIPGGGSDLAKMCSWFNLPGPGGYAHTAAGDALATARLLQHLLGCIDRPLTPERLLRRDPTRRPRFIESLQRRPVHSPPWIASRHTVRFKAREPSRARPATGPEAEYRRAVYRAVEDLTISAAELSRLQALQANLPPGVADQVHHKAWETAHRRYLEDGVLTHREARHEALLLGCLGRLGFEAQATTSTGRSTP